MSPAETKGRLAGKALRYLLMRWFGLRCLVLWCPGEIVNSKCHDHRVYWRCTICGAHTNPR